VRATKKILGLPVDETFWVPPEVTEFYRRAVPAGAAHRQAWQRRFEAWTGDRDLWDACWQGRGVAGWADKLPSWQAGENVATRRAINACLNAVVDLVPALVAGGADLTGNTGTKLDDMPSQSVEHPEGRQINFGVREHGMGGIMNGLAHHGGALPVGGTFFIFSDYMRGAIRLAALSQAKVIYSFTHDSVGLGEDGSTHQPVEQLASLSEVSLCVEAAGLLSRDGISARVVSMPSWELFEEQDDDYQDGVLGYGAPVLSVEAASSFGWSRWADDSVALDHFGASASGAALLKEFGFTPDHVADRAHQLLDVIEEDE
jgi:transketolase